jgi:hypothetical protein
MKSRVCEVGVPTARIVAPKNRDRDRGNYLPILLQWLDISIARHTKTAVIREKEL